MTPTAGDARDAGAVAAVIDIGSNSVLLLTVAVERGRARALDAALATTRLGTGLRPGGRLDAGALAQTRDAAVAFAGRTRARGARRVWAFATAALREAADGSAAADAIAAAAGAPVEVLSGEWEAELAYAAIAAAARAGGTPLLVADVGGRTTELTLGAGERVLGATSLPLGALALTEAHGADLEERVAGALGAHRIVVSDHGVRHAYLRLALARDGVHADFGELWP